MFSFGCRDYVKPKKIVKQTQLKGFRANKLRLRFDKKDDLYNTLNDFVPGKVFDRSLDSFEFKIGMINDQFALGAFESIFPEWVDRGLGVDGRDEGATHKIFFSVSKAIAGDYHLTLEYSSQLLTDVVEESKYRDSDGVLNVNQHFLENNILKFMLDNKNQGNLTYYTVSLGWQKINQTKIGNFVFSTAHQQSGFHELLIGAGVDTARYNNVVINIPNSLRASKRPKEGLYLEFGLGVQNEIYRSNNTRVVVNSEIMTALSDAESNANRISSNSSASFYFQEDKKSAAYRFGVKLLLDYYYNEKYSSQSSVVFFEFAPNEWYSCGLDVKMREQSAGPDHLLYDKDGDDLYSMYCTIESSV